MKLHKTFGINAVARTCFICGKIIGYSPVGDVIDDDLSNKKQLTEGVVCKECITRLNNETCFIAGETNDEDQLIGIYDVIWIKNTGIKEFFKDTSIIQPINVLTKEGFYNIFGNVINELEEKYENNRT